MGKNKFTRKYNKSKNKFNLLYYKKILNDEEYINHAILIIAESIAKDIYENYYKKI